MNYFLSNRFNTKREIAQHTPGLPTIKHFIEEKKWKEYIYNTPFLFFEYDTLFGKDMREKEEIAPEYYFCVAYYGDESKETTDTVVKYFGYVIRVHFPVTTLKRLDMMWDMAKALDCHLVKGNSTIIDEKKFQKLKEKYDRSKKKIVE